MTNKKTDKKKLVEMANMCEDLNLVVNNLLRKNAILQEKLKQKQKHINRTNAYYKSKIALLRSKMVLRPPV